MQKLAKLLILGIQCFKKNFLKVLHKIVEKNSANKSLNLKYLEHTCCDTAKGTQSGKTKFHKRGV